MAEITTKKKTAGRPKKVEEVVNIDNKEIVDQNEIIKQLMEQIAEQNKKMEELQKKVAFSFWEKYDEDHTVVRFATSWATTKENVEELGEII